MFALVVTAAAVPTLAATERTSKHAAVAARGAPGAAPTVPTTTAVLQKAPPGSRVYRVKGTAIIRTLKVTSGRPPFAGTDIATGTAKLAGRRLEGIAKPAVPFGAGALITRDAYAPPIFTSDLTLLLGGGSLRARVRATGATAGRTLSFSGAGPVKGGTRAYAGATGTLRFSGTQNLRTSTRHDTLTLTLVLPRR
jgi:hypothetical protein